MSSRKLGLNSHQELAMNKINFPPTGQVFKHNQDLNKNIVESQPPDKIVVAQSQQQFTLPLLSSRKHDNVPSWEDENFTRGLG